MEIRRVLVPSVYGTNCYLLADETTGAAAVIDPGADITAALQKALADNGWSLRAIFLTHGHFDHVVGVPSLRTAFPDVPVYLHPGDAEKSDGVATDTKSLGPVTLWRDGDVVPLGDLKVEVLHTPGHTAGSVCLRCRDVLFTGDTLFAGEVGRTDLPTGSFPELLSSLKRLAELEGDYQVLPGHEGVSTLERERQGNLYIHQALGR